MRTFLSLLLMLAPASAWAEDYLVVFSADSVPYRPTKAHTFAALATIERGPDGTPRLCELHSISWLPASGKVRAWALRPEPGRNVPLIETLQRYAADCSRFSLWGPYQVQADFACAFKRQATELESTHEYKAASLSLKPNACDCVRAIEELFDSRRRCTGYFSFGAAASSVIVQKANPWIIDPAATHPEIEPLLGIERFCIRRRTYGDFTTSREQLRSAFGR